MKRNRTKKRTRSLPCPQSFRRAVWISSSRCGKSLGGFALDVRGFVAVNQIGFGGFVHSRGKFADSSRRSGFVATGDSGEDFFAKSPDAALDGTVAIRADFGLTNAFFGGFGVGHDEWKERRFVKFRNRGGHKVKV